MTKTKKLRVMILYGGRSGEHEVSLRSAASVLHHLDTSRFEVIPVSIDKKGKWRLNDLSLLENSVQALPVYQDAPSVILPPHPEESQGGLIGLNTSLGITQRVDVVFPVVHGPLCEDGTLQGLLELANLPYVGCGVLSSAVAMDKDIAKRLIQDAGLPIVPYQVLKQVSWKKNWERHRAFVAENLGYPVFVKPANLGSSVGVLKVKDPSQLEAAVENALRYDSKILIEKAIDAQEIEYAVLENKEMGSPPWVSSSGEIIPTHEFYSYEAKYLDEEGAKLLIPARLTVEQELAGKKIAQEAFDILECEGMARVDLFLDKKTGKFYFNEANTIPGFTSISMYPKLWEYSGISYQDLLSHLIDLAVMRHQRKAQLIREYDKV